MIVKLLLSIIVLLFYLVLKLIIQKYACITTPNE